MKERILRTLRGLREVIAGNYFGRLIKRLDALEERAINYDQYSAHTRAIQGLENTVGSLVAYIQHLEQNTLGGRSVDYDQYA